MDNFGNEHVDCVSEGNFSETQTAVTESSPSTSTSAPIICEYFTKYNYCKYGASCKFSHVMKYTSRQFGRKKPNFAYFPNKNYIKTKGFNTENPSPKYKEHYNYKSNEQCMYFSSGFCKNGENCFFSHHVNKYLPTKSFHSQSIAIPGNSKSNSTKQPVCRFFKQGFCYLQDKCKFLHPSDSANGRAENNISKKVENTVIEKEIVTTTNFVNQNDVLNKPKFISNQHHSAKNAFDLASMTEEIYIQLRNTEIKQFKLRFPKCEEIAENKFSFFFEPSDPDWPFDLRTLKLKVTFPEKYPLEICKIKVIQDTNALPEILMNYLNQSIEDWLNNRYEDFKKNGKVEINFRIFLKWLDKNLEDLFVCGLKKVKRDLDAQKSGIEFVPADQLFRIPSNSDEEKEENNSSISELELPNLEKKTENVNDVASGEASKASSTKIKFSSSQLLTHNALKFSVKVLFSNLEFEDGIATLSCIKLSLTLSCIRCKTLFNLIALPSKNQRHKCSKCNKQLECLIETSMIHEFSGLLGILYLTDCQILDANLVDSKFLADCLNCSKQSPCDGLHYGQKQKMWCFFCSQKFTFSIGTVRFQSSNPINTTVQNATDKKNERRKDILIKAGEPLPDFGTCKHYRKSFRWLRFPCCGRLYPCDICHDDKEIDHEMKFATRMLCGYCSKEQPYTKNRPCIFCSSTVTVKRTIHWEGGRGCRNKYKLDRRDKQKFTGCNKTISRKAAASNPAKKN